MHYLGKMKRRGSYNENDPTHKRPGFEEVLQDLQLVEDQATNQASQDPYFSDEILQTSFRSSSNVELLNFVTIFPQYERCAKKVFGERYTEEPFIFSVPSNLNTHPATEARFCRRYVSVFASQMVNIKIEGSGQITSENWIMPLIGGLQNVRKLTILNPENIINLHGILVPVSRTLEELTLTSFVLYNDQW